MRSEQQSVTSTQSDRYYWDEYDVYDLDKWNIPQFFDVIVVEDDVTTVRLIKAIARRTNNFARIKSFKTAEEAIEHLKTIKRKRLTAPDLAIIDIYLRGPKDGFSVCQEISLEFPETNLVITTSMHPKLVSERVHRLNTQPTFLPKPFTIKQVASLFERLN